MIRVVITTETPKIVTSKATGQHRFLEDVSPINCKVFCTFDVGGACVSVCVCGLCSFTAVLIPQRNDELHT